MERVFDASINYIFSFTLFEPDCTLAEEEKVRRVRDALRRQFPSALADWEPGGSEDPIFRDMATVEGFLHGGGLPFPCRRIRLRDLGLTYGEGTLQETAVLFSFFPEFNVGQLVFGFQGNDLTTDQLIYFRQIFGGAAPFRASNGEEGALNYWFRRVMMEMKLPYDNVDTTYLVELKATRPESTVEKLLEQESRRLYGILTGDEGWQFVPLALAQKRMESQWGSRDFTRLVVFGNNGLFLNLNRSPLGQDYLTRQEAYGSWAYGGVNPYFRLDCPLAGVCHGILLSQEMVIVIKTICSRILERQQYYEKHPAGGLSKAIQRTRLFRRELIITLNRVENIGIMEIGELEQLLLNSQKITPLIDSIKYLLELLEGELDLLYQQSTNRLVNILTVAGLAISALGLLSNFGLF